MAPRIRQLAVGLVCTIVVAACILLPANGATDVDRLIKALGDEHGLARYSAADALGKIGPVTDDVIPALIEALGDEHGLGRLHAARALSKTGPAAEDAIPALQGLSANEAENPDVREAARHAIAEIHEVTDRNDK